jgi:hypothetical protein
VLHEIMGSRGIKDVGAFDRVHLECTHYVDEKKQIIHGRTRRCAICQTKKVPA